MTNTEREHSLDELLQGLHLNHAGMIEAGGKLEDKEVAMLCYRLGIERSNFVGAISVVVTRDGDEAGDGTDPQPSKQFSQLSDVLRSALTEGNTYGLLSYLISCENALLEKYTKAISESDDAFVVRLLDEQKAKVMESQILLARLRDRQLPASNDQQKQQSSAAKHIYPHHGWFAENLSHLG